jgi:hypothetical protein
VRPCGALYCLPTWCFWRQCGPWHVAVVSRRPLAPHPPPTTSFHLYGRKPANTSNPSGGLCFKPMDGAVLMLDAARIWHHASSHGHNPHSQDLKRGGMFGAAYMLKLDTIRAAAAVSDAAREAARGGNPHMQK